MLRSAFLLALVLLVPLVTVTVPDRHIVADTVAVAIVGGRKAVDAGVKALNLGPITIIQPGELFR